MRKVEPLPKKMLFSKVPIGSIFFQSYDKYSYFYFDGQMIPMEEGTILEFLVETKLEDFEMPTCEYNFIDIPLNNFVSYEDIKKYGFKYCVKHKIYDTISLTYIGDVQKIRSLNTIKDLKEYLETEL